jgi:hypothetical protein
VVACTTEMPIDGRHIAQQAQQRIGGRILHDRPLLPPHDGLWSHVEQLLELLLGEIVLIANVKDLLWCQKSTVCTRNLRRAARYVISLTRPEVDLAAFALTPQKFASDGDRSPSDARGDDGANAFDLAAALRTVI